MFCRRCLLTGVGRSPYGASRFLWAPLVGAILGLVPSVAFTQTAATESTVTVEATGVVKKRPQRMRLSVGLLAEGKDLAEALAGLDKRRQDALKELEALGVLSESIEVGPPRVLTDRFVTEPRAVGRPTPSRLIGGPIQAPPLKAGAQAKPPGAEKERPRKQEEKPRSEEAKPALEPVPDDFPLLQGFPFPGNLPLPPGFSPPSSASPQKPTQPIVSAPLTADFVIDDAGALQVLLRTEELKQKIEKLDLAGRDKINASWSCRACGTEPGKPTFLFVAKLTEEDRARACADAYRRARQWAETLATATGQAKLGRVYQVIAGGLSASATPTPAAGLPTAELCDAPEPVDEVTGPSLEPLPYRVSFTVVFEGKR